MISKIIIKLYKRDLLPKLHNNLSLFPDCNTIAKLHKGKSTLQTVCILQSFIANNVPLWAETGVKVLRNLHYFRKIHIGYRHITFHMAVTRTSVLTFD